MVLQRLEGGMPAMIPEQCTMRNEGVHFDCATIDSPVTTILPSIRSLNYRWVDIRFFDTDRNCEKNTITIQPSEGDRINGSNDPIVLGKNGAAAIVMIFGQNDWKCVVFE